MVAAWFGFVSVGYARAYLTVIAISLGHRVYGKLDTAMNLLTVCDNFQSEKAWFIEFLVN